jgi:predicted GIY-YIG superfamily endonuclease
MMMVNLHLHNKLQKSTKVKLVWPFTSNAIRKNGEKSTQVETDVKKTTRETKEQMGR